MDVKLGETRFFDFVTVDPATGFPAAIFSAVFDVHLGGSNGPEAYHPNIVTREGVGHYSTNVQITTANGFVVGTNYSVSAIVTFTDGGQEYEIPLGNFTVRAYSIDDVYAKVAPIGTVGATVPSDRLNAGEISIVVGDDYNSALLNPKEFTATGFPDSTGATCWFGVGHLDGGFVIPPVEGTVTGSGTVVATFELTKEQTALLTPDTTYGYSWQIENASGERTGGRGECAALRKWDD
jgi:hypothetical protein